MAASTTSSHFVNVYQSVDKTKRPVTTSLTVASSAPSLSGDTEEIKATLPEYYTAPPWRLLWDDLVLFIRCIGFIPFVISPLWYPRREGVRYPKLDKSWVPRWLLWGPIDSAISAIQTWYQGKVDPYYPSGEMDELYPSVGNLWCLFIHGILIVTQLAFLISLPFLATLPFQLFVLYIGGFIFVNYIFCLQLNAGTENNLLKSQHALWPEAANWKSLDPKENYSEEWIFLNGVSVGSHWLQGNINRLSRTFQRPITGVHNRTSGIIFDLIQCLLERCFYFGTSDTRTCYALITAALDPAQKKDKTVLILHSQGGLEGSIILDWLLSNYRRETLHKLEIYTFGNAANHFNDPETSQNEHVFGHIEHYGNTGDFVSQWGVIHFKSLVAEQSNPQPMDGRHPFLPIVDDILRLDKRQNTFAGLLFENNVLGHLLNQHYLDRLFPLNETLTRVVESKGKPLLETFMARPMRAGNGTCDVEGHKVCQKSRLWEYINGKKPKDYDLQQS
ncbi:hypothetical protein CFIO01_03507 [Colletotrichum fioriniae PJ7]|uniref:Uncharacterized protein n=1 Tax=Colletotrichum fioriniae PJ7 TaxID=1445577 RepID=A0A010R922_9PEZI|nr:hypothetical protein CFIO01_03507 [Colletotrichum fioriniae PJ7]